MYLAYRDLPKLIQQYVLAGKKEPIHLKILDYGCGPGVSTRQLLDIFSQLECIRRNCRSGCQ